MFSNLVIHRLSHAYEPLCGKCYICESVKGNFKQSVL